MNPDEIPNAHSPSGVSQQNSTAGQKVEKNDGSRTRARRSSPKAMARRAAVTAKLARDARLRVRELDIETALAQYYEGVTTAEQIVLRARHRATEIVTDAEAAAAVPWRAATAAVRQLKDLGEDRASVAELTGLSPAQVRDCLTGNEQAGPGVQAG